MDTLRVAQFGLTHPHSLAHLKTLQLSDMVRGIVLYDDDARVVAEVRTTMGNKVEGGYHNLDEILDRNHSTSESRIFRITLTGRYASG